MQQLCSTVQMFHEFFEKQVQLDPEAIAVRFEDQQLSYAQLNQRANQLAHYLKRLGVQPEHRVGVCLERTLDALVTLLAIFKAGGAYVPLAPDYPSERLNYMLADSRVTVLVTSTDVMARLDAATTIYLDEDWDRIAQESSDNPESDVREENLAYVIYTSGSTGRPKGVTVEHRALANTLAASRERFGFTRTDVMPCLASFSFDISLFELCNPLCAGGTVVIWDQKDILDVQQLVDSLADFTLLHCVPTLMRQVVDWMKETNSSAGKLRQVFVGGEAVGIQLLDQMRDVFPNAAVHVLYGPTEAAMICATRAVDTHVTVAPIGTSIQNMQLYVLDHELKRCGTEVGELYLGGAGLARGYLNRPELTAERFVPNCFSEHEGERLYRTGDLVRWGAGGNLEFVGRLDQQVKIRGHRIELREIETALESCPGIAEAAVTVREDQPGQLRLVAYVVPESGSQQRRAVSTGATFFSPAICDYEDELAPTGVDHPLYQAISETVRTRLGNIGGSKGLETYLEELQSRFDSDANFFPQRCVTQLSAVELPESWLGFDELCFEQVQQIFVQTGYPFDLRVCVHQLPPDSLISGKAAFEEIEVHAPGPESTERGFELTINRDALLSGFVLSLELFDHTDCCYQTDAPLFVPAFAQGVRVAAGDRIVGKSIRRPSREQPRRMDYSLDGRILFRNGDVKSFFYRLPYVQRVFQGSAFYKRLFSGKTIEELLAGPQRRDTRELVQELSQRLRATLPDYMMPSAIVPLDEFPLSPNGKLDRKALPAPEYGNGPDGRAASGPEQELLCTLFAETLGVPRVSLDDSFFDLGGDSIMLIQLVRRIRSTLGCKLSIRSFYEGPTVAALTEKIFAAAA